MGRTADDEFQQGAAQVHPSMPPTADVIDGRSRWQQPKETQAVDLARLLIRYDGFSRRRRPQLDLAKDPAPLGLSRDQLHQRTRALWSSGYAQGMAVGGDAWGSGFDRRPRTPLSAPIARFSAFRISAFRRDNQRFPSPGPAFALHRGFF